MPFMIAKIISSKLNSEYQLKAPNFLLIFLDKTLANIGNLNQAVYCLLSSHKGYIHEKKLNRPLLCMNAHTSMPIHRATDKLRTIITYCNHRIMEAYRRSLQQAVGQPDLLYLKE